MERAGGVGSSSHARPRTREYETLASRSVAGRHRGRIARRTSPGADGQSYGLGESRRDDDRQTCNARRFRERRHDCDADAIRERSNPRGCTSHGGPAEHEPRTVAAGEPAARGERDSDRLYDGVLRVRRHGRLDVRRAAPGFGTAR